MGENAKADLGGQWEGEMGDLGEFGRYVCQDCVNERQSSDSETSGRRGHRDECGGRGRRDIRRLVCGYKASRDGNRLSKESVKWLGIECKVPTELDGILIKKEPGAGVMVRNKQSGGSIITVLPS